MLLLLFFLNADAMPNCSSLLLLTIYSSFVTLKPAAFFSLIHSSIELSRIKTPVNIALRVETLQVILTPREFFKCTVRPAQPAKLAVTIKATIAIITFFILSLYLMFERK